MGVYRLYTGDDGRSRVEELDPASNPGLTSPQATASIAFREWPAGHFIDWHPAPRRQWVITLSGQIEIGLSDGNTGRYGPGDARLVEDTTGQGHTTRFPGSPPSTMAVIPLAD